MVNVAINGFGRIGRQALQAGLDDSKIKWVAINDLTDTKTLAYLFKHDSVYGEFPGKVTYDEKNLYINKYKIPVFSEREPDKLPWKQLKVDVVVESTGVFEKKEQAIKHITAGAKKVIISAPSDDADLTVVLGVNDKSYNKQSHVVISNGSCTTNCLAPMIRVLHDNFRVQYGFMNTIHAYTATQSLVDSPQKDVRRGRAAAHNIVPTTTGATRSVAEAIPELKGKLDGVAIRVPVLDGSLTDFTCIVEKETTDEQVNQAFKRASQGYLKGILQYSDEPLVSTDIIKNPHSTVFDSLLTKVMAGRFIKVFGWYDNEWGYSKRVVELIKRL